MHQQTHTSRPSSTHVPWWLHILIAILCYWLLKYFLPSLVQGQSAAGRLLLLAPQLAPIVAIVFLLLAAFALYRSDETPPAPLDHETLRSMEYQAIIERLASAYTRQGYFVTGPADNTVGFCNDLFLDKGKECSLLYYLQWQREEYTVEQLQPIIDHARQQNITAIYVMTPTTFSRASEDFAENNNLTLISADALLSLLNF